VGQGWQKHFSFGLAKYSAGVMHSCRGYEAADYSCKSTYAVHLGVYPLWDLGSQRGHLLAIHISAHFEKRRVSLIKLRSPQLHFSGHLHVSAFCIMTFVCILHHA